MALLKQFLYLKMNKTLFIHIIYVIYLYLTKIYILIPVNKIQNITINNNSLHIFLLLSKPFDNQNNFQVIFFASEPPFFFGRKINVSKLTREFLYENFNPFVYSINSGLY